MMSSSALKAKPEKYKFPKQDPPAMQGLSVFTPTDIYLYILNLIYHRLTPETYDLWCQLTERDVSFPEMSKQGILETNYSLKHQREKYKKNQGKANNAIESNRTLEAEGQKAKIISPEVLAKLKDDQHLISLYISHRQEFITMLNDLIELNHSHAFTKIVKKMLKLANKTQGSHFKKIIYLQKKLLHSYNNSSSFIKPIIYKCQGASTKEEDNIRLPFTDCILDFSKTGTIQPVIACMLDSGYQISICSYSMFKKLGGDQSSLDKSKSFSISSTTELRDDCILGVVKVDLFIMLKLKSGQP